MPLIGYVKTCKCEADFRHKNGNGKEVDCVEVDHYANVCPDPPYPRLLAKVLYEDLLDSRRYRQDSPVVSATALTRCPLQSYLERHVDFVQDPLEDRWMMRGLFAHEGLLGKLRGDPRYMVEQPFKTEAFGFPFFFTPDCYDWQDGTLYDMKTQNMYAVRSKGKKTDEEVMDDQYVKDNMTQVNVYATALETFGIPVRSIELQYWDGDLEVRRLAVERVPYEKTEAFIRERGKLVYDILCGKVEEALIRKYAKPIPNGKWSPMKGSGVYYLLKAA